MENRDIKKHLTNIEGALQTYSHGISHLRGEALDIASEFLGKPPEYWESNANEAHATLAKLNIIEESGRSLEAELGTYFPDCNE